jgi:hypothetical protein
MSKLISKVAAATISLHTKGVLNAKSPCDTINHMRAGRKDNLRPSHLRKDNPKTTIKITVFFKGFCSRRWGASLTVCARLTVHSSPHRHKRKFSGACVCRVTFKHLPQPLRRHIWIFGTLGQLFKIPPFSAQKSHSAGGRGGPRIFFWLQS